MGDYFQRLKEPLLTFHLYDVFVNILSEYRRTWTHPEVCASHLAAILTPPAGLLQDREVATEALQVSCLLLPPPNRRRLQLLLRLMARVCQNPLLPPLNDFISTRTLVPWCPNGRMRDVALCVKDRPLVLSMSV